MSPSSSPARAFERNEGDQRKLPKAERRRKQRDTPTQNEVRQEMDQNKLKAKLGFYLILQGRCKVLNRDDGYCGKILQGGDFFGESDILKCIGYEYFGDVIVETKECECLFVTQEDFMKLPIFERMSIKEYSRKREALRLLAYEYSERYKEVDLAEYDHYYS